MRPDIWNCSRKEWEKYLETDEGKADKKEWERKKDMKNIGDDQN